MSKIITRLLKCERGQGTAEYIIVAVLVVLTFVVVFSVYGGSIKTIFGSLGRSLTGQETQTGKVDKTSTGAKESRTAGGGK